MERVLETREERKKLSRLAPLKKQNFIFFKDDHGVNPGVPIRRLKPNLPYPKSSHANRLFCVLCNNKLFQTIVQPCFFFQSPYFPQNDNRKSKNLFGFSPAKDYAQAIITPCIYWLRLNFNFWSMKTEVLKGT